MSERNSERKTPSAASRPDFAELFLRRIEEIPTLPRVVLRVVELCNDPMSTMGQFDQAFASDAALASRVLRLVNSGYFALPRPVSSISRAVTFLGFTAVRAVALSVGANKVFRPVFEAKEWEVFWNHSVATSETARLVSHTVRIGSPDDAQAAGLFHDLARFLVPVFFAEQAAELLEEGGGLGDPVREREVLGTDHAELGALLIERWSLPRSVIDGIRHHHGDDQALRSDPTALAVHIAEQLTFQWGLPFCDRGERRKPAPAAQPILEAWADPLARLEAQVRDRLDQAHAVLG